MNPHADVEQRAAGRVLLIVASNLTPMSEKYSGWVLTATGAAVALLLTRLETLTQIVSIASIKWGLATLLFSILMGLVVRYLSAVVESALKVEQEITELAEQVAREHQASRAVAPFNPDIFLDEMLKALLQPTRWLVRRNLRRKISGDHLGSIRLLAKLSQISGRLILVQFLLVALGPMLIILGVKS